MYSVVDDNNSNDNQPRTTYTIGTLKMTRNQKKYLETLENNAANSIYRVKTRRDLVECLDLVRRVYAIYRKRSGDDVVVKEHAETLVPFFAAHVATLEKASSKKGFGRGLKFPVYA